MPYVKVDDHRLFVDVRGEVSNPAVLYLHGGPGASCHHFMLWQGDLLSPSCYVVGLDQRGVLRSDPLISGEHLTEQTLVNDCESIRESLDIPRWTVIGHSFGGRIALRYACQHPNRVTAVIFENPCWDFDDTERQRLPAAAAIFDELGDRDSADRCRRIASRSARIVDWRETVELVGQLEQHGRYDDLYYHQLAARERWLSTDMSAFSEEQLSRAQAHNEQALDGCMEPLVDMLAELVTPAILVKGKYDLITGQGQLGAFQAKVRHGDVRYFDRSGHFVQLEESGAYAELVARVNGGVQA